MRYIGMDAHTSICVLSVLDGKGVEIDNVSIETNARLLINYLQSIKGKKALTFEECEISGWLYENLHHEVDELVVCNPVHNRDYKGPKTDKLDARRLADLLRGGFLQPVYHDGSKREQFRSLMGAYDDLVWAAVAFKNRYKSLYRREGHNVRGTSLYNDESFLDDFQRKDYRFIGERTFRILERMEEERQSYLKEIQRASKNFPEIKCLKTLPGIGPIQAAKIVAHVVDPRRFRNKYKYYAYCGLVRHRKISAGRSYGNKQIQGNRSLKCVYQMAAHSALKGTSGLRRHYDRLRCNGVSHKNAAKAVARKIAAMSLSVWRQKTRYNDRLIDYPLK